MNSFQPIRDRKLKIPDAFRAIESPTGPMSERIEDEEPRDTAMNEEKGSGDEKDAVSSCRQSTIHQPTCQEHCAVQTYCNHDGASLIRSPN